MSKRSNRHNAIRETVIRSEIQVHLPDGRVFEAPRGTPLLDLFTVAYPDPSNPALAAIVAGELRELACPVERDTEATPIFLSSADGIRIYSRSLSFLLVAVAYELFPKTNVHIDYSVPHGGYFCRAEGRKPFSTAELLGIRERMMELVREDRPIHRRRYAIDEATAIFEARGEQSKAQLLRDRQVSHIHLYELNGFTDYFHGYMVPATGVLKTFALEPFAGGFVLRFPRRENPTRLLPAQRFTALREVFDEYGEWLGLVGVRNVAEMNQAIRSGHIEQKILVSEALHEKRIAEIAARLSRQHQEGIQLVFIAGPSSSGKTTFSKRLAIQLLADGLQPYPLAMDNYFHPRTFLRERFGDEADYDSLNALDVTRFEEDLHRLVRGERATLPRYNFRTGERENGPTVCLRANQVLLAEGIHALNPRLVSEMPPSECFRIFVSALTQLNLDIHNRVSTTDTRLIRRLVRDSVFRGYSAEDTLGMWENVRRGEKDNIFPYQEVADVMFNSALVFELAILKPYAEPLLLQVRDPELRIEAERLLALLRWFAPYSNDNIPGNSILREFIGGSTLRDFTPISNESADP